MATGKAYIKGRDGTSTSGAKVSEYSPQYSQTHDGNDAPERSTTDAQIMLSNELTAEQKASVQNSGLNFYNSMKHIEAMERMKEREAAALAEKAQQQQKTVVTLEQAAGGHTANTTASRDATGAIVGSSTGSNYTREQERAAAEAKMKERQAAALAANLAAQQPTNPIVSSVNTGAFFAVKPTETPQATQPFKTVDQANASARNAEVDKWAGNSKTKQVIGDIYLATSSKESLIETYQKAEDVAADKLSFLPSGETVRQKWDASLEKKPDEYGYYGYDDLLEAVGAKKSAESYRKADTAVTEGVQNFAVGEYEGFRTTPIAKTGEYAAYYAGGALIGGAAKGAKVLGKPILETVASPVSKVSGKLLATDSKVLKTAGSKLGTTANAIKTGSVIDIGLGAGFAVESAGVIGKGYIEGGGAGAVESTLQLGKGMVIGVPGFKAGQKSTQKFLESEKFKSFMADETASVSGKNALAKWDKIDAAKKADTPAFELVEDANGNLVLRELSAPKAKPPADKFAAGEKRGRDIINRVRQPSAGESVITGSNGMKTIMKTEIVMKPPSMKIEQPAKVIDLTDAKTPFEIREQKISMFKADQRKMGVQDMVSKHMGEMEFGQKAPVVSESRYVTKEKDIQFELGRNRKMTTSQRVAYERKMKQQKMEELKPAEMMKPDELMKVEQPKLTEMAKTKEATRIDLKMLDQAKYTERTKLLEKTKQRELFKQAEITVPKTKTLYPTLAASKFVQNMIPGVATVQKPATINTMKPITSQVTSPITAPITSIKQSPATITAAINMEVPAVKMRIPSPGSNRPPRYDPFIPSFDIPKPKPNPEPRPQKDIIRIPRAGSGKGKELIFDVPDFGRSKQMDRVTDPRFKKRKKTHALLDPGSFVVGKKISGWEKGRW